VLPPVFAALLCVLPLGHSAAAQDGSPRPRTIEPDAPGPREAIAAFERVRAILAGAPNAEPENSEPTAFVGANLTVRLAGAIVAAERDSAGPGAAERAARAMVRSVEGLSDIAGRVSIDLELVAAFVPSAYDAITEPGLAPGIEGFAVRIGERGINAIYPSQIMQRTLSPRDAIVAGVSNELEPGDPALADPSLLPERHDATLYRFTTTRLAASPGEPAPRFVFRTGAVVPASSIDAQRMRADADRVAAHLIARVRKPERAGPSPTIFADPYDALGPAIQRPDPATQCLAAYALIRAAEAGVLDPVRAIEAQAVAWSILDAHRGSIRLMNPWKASAVAAFAVASDNLRAEPRLTPADFVELRRALTDDVLGRVPAPIRAVVAFGLAELSTRTGVADAERAREVLAGIYESADVGGLPAAMPFALLAELALTPEGERPPAAQAYEALREIAASAQLAEADAPLEPDLVGGFALTTIGGRTAPPTWQSLRVAAALAAMLGDESLTPAEDLPQHLSVLLGSIRFAAQLQVSPEWCVPCADANAAEGGFRAANWSYDMPLAASATGLLLLTETLESLDARASAEEAPDAAEGG